MGPPRSRPTACATPCNTWSQKPLSDTVKRACIHHGAPAKPADGLRHAL
nr:MAG TPA: hypothetical protein [Inoviridae sp.]